MKTIKRNFIIILCAILFINTFAVLITPLSADAATEYIVIPSSSTVNIRAGAGANYAVVTTSSAGAEYKYISEKKDSSGTVWYQIYCTSSKKGWITSKYSQKVAVDYSDLQPYINAMSKSYGAVGSQVAVIENGTVTDTYAYGYATKNTFLMKNDTKIRVASLSKIAVAMSAMRMQEQGIVNINTNIGSYWGASLPKNITLKSLLSHTSTIKELSYNSTLEGTLSQIKSSSSYVSGTVGSASSWDYCNYGAGLAGSTLEVASKKILTDYANEQFFKPLGIEASWHAGLLSVNKLATLYYNDGRVARSSATQAAIKPRAYGCNTNSFAGGFTTSAKDMAKLIAILANDGTYNGKRYLSKESVSAIEANLFKASENGASFTQCMPLRYKANLYGQDKLYYHTGNAYGVVSFAAYNPSTKCGVVVITIGAGQQRDSQGIYSICSKLTNHVFKSLSSNAAKPTTTTAPTTTTTTAPVIPDVPAQSINIAEDNISMEFGQTRQLTLEMTPVSATDVISWKSSSSCVTVDSQGKIKAAGYGTAVITAKGYAASDTCTVKIVPDFDITMLGASVRVSDPYGIRFGIKIKKDTAFKNADIVEYGTLIIGSGTLGDKTLELKTESVLRIPAVNILNEDSSQLTYTGVLIDIPESFFSTDVTARGYIIYKDANGTKHIQYTDTATKNFNTVARSAYDAYNTLSDPTEEQTDILSKLESILGITAESEATVNE